MSVFFILGEQINTRTLNWAFEEDAVSCNEGKEWFQMWLPDSMEIIFILIFNKLTLNVLKIGQE